MITVEAICFLMVAVGSMGLFYYLGWLAGRESVISETLMWNEFEERNDEDE